MAPASPLLASAPALKSGRLKVWCMERLRLACSYSRQCVSSAIAAASSSLRRSGLLSVLPNPGAATGHLTWERAAR